MVKGQREILTVSHYIYLDKDQRYLLYQGSELDVVGVSVPVWFKSGNTSEPAKEVFCRYKISTQRGSQGVQAVEEGYRLNLSNFVESDGSFKSILDVKDEGCEELVLRGYSKAFLNGRNLSVFHCIEIKTKDLLLSTMC